MTGLELPFQIGQTLWMARTYPEKVTVPCPVCQGTMAVVVLCGDERFAVPCEGCGLGFNGPQGTITEYDHSPAAVAFTIAEVTSMHQGRWSLCSSTGDHAQFDDLYATEAEAMAASVVTCAENHERNMQTRQYRRKNAKQATWSVRYHRDQIKELERQIAWHQSRLGMPPGSGTVVEGEASASSGRSAAPNTPSPDLE